LGGIVTRKLLHEEKSQLTKKEIALCCFGTPFFGSWIATWLCATGIGRVLLGKQVKELCSNSDFLNDLSENFREMKDDGYYPGFPIWVHVHGEWGGFLRFSSRPSAAQANSGSQRRFF